MHYPGILMWSDFLCQNNNSDDYNNLLNEVNKLGSDYAFQPCTSEEVTIQKEKEETPHHDDNNNNFTLSAYRVTGRPESESQVLAPWGYGDNFNRNNLTVHAPEICKLVDAIEAMYNKSPDNKLNRLGRLRDITVNYRLGLLLLLLLFLYYIIVYYSSIIIFTLYLLYY
jgi:hypothetical protein